MKFEGLPFSVSASILIGILHGAFFLICAGYITVYEPWSMWLIDHEVRNPMLKIILYSISYSIEIILCLPGAYAVCKLRPKKLVLYTSLAVLPLILFSNRLFISDPERLNFLVPWYTHVPGWISEVVPFSLAVLLMHRLTRRSSTFRKQAGSTGRRSAAPLN